VNFDGKMRAGGRSENLLGKNREWGQRQNVVLRVCLPDGARGTGAGEKSGIKQGVQSSPSILCEALPDKNEESNTGTGRGQEKN